MKKLVLLLLSSSLCFTYCSKPKKFMEADQVLKKWVLSIKNLNYRYYKQCEAYPKEMSVFKEMYKTYYLSDLMVTSVEAFDEKNIQTDVKGNKYYHRRVDFECVEVDRKQNKPVKVIRGNVIFIQFIDGKRKNDGWLMSNRTLLRLNR